MPITLNQNMPNEGPEVMYSQAFRQVIEDHLEYIRADSNTELVDIDPHSGHKGHGDLISVLNDYRVDPSLHWVIMRLNGYTSPLEYDRNHLTLLVPTQSLIDGLLRVHRVNRKLARKEQAA